MDKEVLTRFADAVSWERQSEAQMIVKEEILPALNHDWDKAIRCVVRHYNDVLERLFPNLEDLIPEFERADGAMRAHDALLVVAREEKPDLGDAVNKSWHMRHG